MEFDLFFLLQDEPSLMSAKERALRRQRQRRGSLPIFGSATEEDRGLVASVGRSFLRPFAPGDCDDEPKWAPNQISPCRDRRNSI